jgi:2-oxoglutarate dehydrogenase E2 component (dihydrolipoamide succinyltransferase)
MANQIEILMPLMGEGINEATLVKWLKKPGDKVSKSEPLLEVSTDKVDTEIPAPADGFLVATLAKEGEVVQINTVIGHMTSDGSAAVASTAQPAAKPAVKPASNPAPTAAPKPASKPVAPASRPAVAAAGVSHNGAVRSSPLVRKMARDLNINLGFVPGSGLHGRVTRADLDAYVASGAHHSQLNQQHHMGTGQVIFAQAPQSMPAPDALAKSPRVQTTVVDGVEMMEGNPVRREKMTKMRRLIAEHMVESVRVSPHVTTVFEVDLHNVYEIREKHRAAFEAREGFKLTYTPFFIHAAVQAIKQHPIINVSLDGDDILWKQDINVGCAVALGNGLIVPVIKKAQDLNLTGVAHRLNDLVSRARSKKLLPEDVQGGTFSITNPGGFGSLTSNPIINQPQVAILGIGAVVKRPVVINDAITIRPMMMISLTFDHRVVDGEGGANYLATLKKILENYSEEPN